jgi:predicted HTH transcriptional regulator
MKGFDFEHRNQDQELVVFAAFRAYLERAIPSFAVSTRAASTQAPAAYEIPPEVIREAIVNAVAHRDCTSNGSVQVMVFAYRVEIWNPANPLLAEPSTSPNTSNASPPAPAPAPVT